MKKAKVSDVSAESAARAYIEAHLLRRREYHPGRGNPQAGRGIDPEHIGKLTGWTRPQINRFLIQVQDEWSSPPRGRPPDTTGINALFDAIQALK